MAWSTPKTWTPGELVTAAQLNEFIRDNMNAMFPVGSFLLRAASYTTVETAVEGRWLQCNGVAVSRTTYAVLFNYLNGMSPALPFGVGNGSTTFGLPDLRGRVVVAEGEHAEIASMGQSDGGAIGVRTPLHYHEAGFGASSVGGTVPNPSSYDTGITQSFPTSPLNNISGRNTRSKDAPAFQVVGSWFIKYTT